MLSKKSRNAFVPAEAGRFDYVLLVDDWRIVQVGYCTCRLQKPIMSASGQLGSLGCDLPHRCLGRWVKLAVLPDQAAWNAGIDQDVRSLITPWLNLSRRLYPMADSSRILTFG